MHHEHEIANIGDSIAIEIASAPGADPGVQRIEPDDSSDNWPSVHAVAKRMGSEQVGHQQTRDAARQQDGFGTGHPRLAKDGARTAPSGATIESRHVQGRSTASTGSW